MQLTPLIAADPGRFCRRCSQCRLPPFRRSLLRHAFDEPLCGRGENRKVRLRTCRRRNLGTIVFVGVFSVNRRQLSPAAPDRLHEARALLAQNALHAPDRVALTVEQVANAAQEIDVFGTIEASSSAPLHRSDLRESAFPETQHMLRHIDLVGNFANGAECPRRLVHWPVPREDNRALTPLWRGLPVRLGIDPLLKNCGRFKHHHTPRRNRYFLTRLRVPSDTLALLAH